METTAMYRLRIAPVCKSLAVYGTATAPAPLQ